MTEVAPGWGTALALALFVASSAVLGGLASRWVQRGAFMKGYFLGNRDLGSWALALTATVQSGGTFMGFPSFVYTFGWVVALWIGAYMVVPITGFGLVGKRVAEISRKTGALTVPDLFRERFACPTVGFVSTLFVLFFMSFMLVAQFKAGALIMKLAWPASGWLSLADDRAGGIDATYYLGLIIFSLVVVGYTLLGGFLAAVWTDLYQSVVMLIGVLILLPLCLSAAGGLEAASRSAAEQTGPGFLFGPGYSPDERQFLTPTLAASYFFIWIFGGVGAPASIVRLMACKSTKTIRRSIVLLALYNMMIYLPLIAICVCARSLMPDLKHSDEVIPRIALGTTKDLPGGPFIAGIILAAPFGAVMSTVSSYLVVISSGIVRDVYQRFIDPAASERRLRGLAQGGMIAVGLLAVIANINPVAYIQQIVVFCTSGQAATFFVPVIMAMYWRRATKAGALGAMLAGSITVLGLFALGWIAPLIGPSAYPSWLGFNPLIGPAGQFRACLPFGVDPVVWGLIASTVAGIGISLATDPPPGSVVDPLFDADSPSA